METNTCKSFAIRLAWELVANASLVRNANLPQQRAPERDAAAASPAKSLVNGRLTLLASWLMLFSSRSLKFNGTESSSPILLVYFLVENVGKCASLTP